MSDNEQVPELIDTIKQALNSKQPLLIQGGDSKSFYGNSISADILSVKQHTGVIDYEPSELYVTARCGTPLREIEAMLAEHNQIFPFEPPSFGDDATLGGTVACGFSGPRRPYASSIRDCVLGTHIINGKGEYLKFGGQVMKNVAGYDVSRAMCGAMGTLGIITQVSLKLIPQPESELTLMLEYKPEQALNIMHQYMQTDFPITATYFENNILYIRAAGIEKTIKKIKQIIGGNELQDSQNFWVSVKEHQREFFNSDLNLWKCNVPVNSPDLAVEGDYVMEWNGGLRWYSTNDGNEKLIAATKSVRGNATLFKSTSKPNDCFTQPTGALKKLHSNLKTAFDPENILNPGRLYSWL
ncbi:MAG: glycolate oxidase subunit GlcE [Pseudomonadota bacterium]